MSATQHTPPDALTELEYPDAFVARLLRLGRASLHEPDRRGDEQEELQELRLPVLRHVDAEVRRGDELSEADAGHPVVGEFGIVAEVAGDRLPRESEDEDREEEQTQSVVPQCPPHRHLPPRGRAIITISPTTMIPIHDQNIARMPAVSPRSALMVPPSVRSGS